MKQYSIQLTLGPLAKLAEAVIDLILPLLMASLIDNGIGAGDKDHIYSQSLIMFILVAAGFGFSLFCQHSACVAGMGFGKNLRSALTAKIGRLNKSQTDRLGAQSVANRLTIDVSQAETGLAMVIRLALRSPFLVAGGIIMAVVVDAQLSLVLVALAPLFVGLILYVRKKSVPLVARGKERLDNLSGQVRQNLAGLREIRAFNREEGQKEAFAASNKEWRRAVTGANVFSALLSPLTGLLTNLGIIAVVLMAGARMDVPSGKLIAFIGYITQITFSMVVLANLSVILLTAGESAVRINALLDLPEEEDAAGESAEPVEGAPVLEITQLSFSYPQGHFSLSDINIVLGAGETAGIIGGTGSGKSTLAALITKQMPFDEGEIKTRGVSLRNTAGGAKGGVILVTQKAALFKGTVRENLDFGGGFSDGEIWAALNGAQIAKFVEKIGGLDAPVSENGSNFSGGQKQRLSIARALVRRPALIIFDDSASALDAITAGNVIKAAAVLGCAVIFISQRVSDVAHFERIFVLDSGRLIASGSHKELLHTCPHYAEIMRSQTGGGDA